MTKFIPQVWTDSFKDFDKFFVGFDDQIVKMQTPVRPVRRGREGGSPPVPGAAGAG